MKNGKKEKASQWQRNSLNNMVLDYHVYEMTGKEKIQTILIAVVVGGVAGLIFYGGLFKEDGEATTMTWIADAVIFVLAGMIAALVFLPIRKQRLLEQRQKTLRAQFRDMLASLTTSLSAGDTVVQAFDNAYQDMCTEYGEDSYIANEVYQFVVARKNNVSVEDVVDDFAKRSANEDVESFASVFRASYGPGGRMSDVMRNTHDVITQKMEIEDEIESKISSNKLELNIITVMPIVIVGILRVATPIFADSFASPVGMLINTAAIAIFIGAYMAGQKIVRIQV